MAAAPSVVSTDPFAVTGPALVYVSTPHGDGSNLVQRVDLDSPADPRERAVCRALLHHALALLDSTEPARHAPVGVEDRRR